MEERNKYIENYILNMGNQLKSSGISVTDDQINHVMDRYLSSNDSIEEIIKQIDELVANFVEDFNRRQQERANLTEKMTKMHDLQDLPPQYTGITLNNQDIDLMLIAGANNFQELQEALSKITNINVSLNTLELTEEQFELTRQQVYDVYLDTLTSRNDFIKNRNIELTRKIQYLKYSGKITPEESTMLDEIISSSSGIDQIVERLNQTFNPEKIHTIYETIRDFSPIEKMGIKSTTIEASRNLLEQVKNNYNSITIDEEAKYGRVVLQDGTFDFKHLQKSLDFAKSLGKQVRLNTLLFYMDCPESLYNLEKNEQNKILVKQKLQSYVDATTRFIMDNGYDQVVRSIDVFNELLNRHAMSGDIPYTYRGHIDQNESLYEDFDNVKSGWLKHLEIEDLCDVITVARKNMPSTDFMYNDDHLTDSRKIPATVEIIGEIQRYEKSHDTKLIDSIGTQMHLDNDVSKEQIRQMIINLSQFGLPIEITEFDLAMTSGVEGLTDKQIEQMRQQKINEVYECVEELREQCNIRGFTIWSKTDKQNFRVNLENEVRLARGLEPIETLHGGAFTEKMESKSKSLVKQNNFQDFNYHTHTNRCGHAGVSSDNEYVEYAKVNGITRLGFSDHVPVTELEYQDGNQQMHISDVDEYIASIRKLQQENPEMEIICGFEAEFDPMKEQFLGELRERVDYMILGQHFVQNGMQQVQQKNNPNYPLEYANIVCKAMESGIFDIVAHPDIFMQFRDTLETDTAKEKFMQNAIIASKAICEKAKEIGIPLEINFGGIDKNEVLQDGKVAYPYSEFWKIAAETGVQVLYGVDAYTPEQFARMSSSKQQADNIIGTPGLTFVAKDYSPVKARKNNKKLNELYNAGQAKALTYETNMISQIIGRIIDRVPDESFNPSDFAFISDQAIDSFSRDCAKRASTRADKTMAKIENISDSQELSTQERKFQLDRAKSIVEHTSDTLSHQQKALERAKQSIKTAVEMGCQSKSEIKNTVAQLTEAKTTKNQEKKRKIAVQVQTIQSMDKTNTNTNTKQQNKGQVLVKRSSQNKSTSNHGFVNVFNLVLIILSTCCLAVSIGYILYKIVVD